MLKPEQYEAITYLAQPNHGGLSQDEIAAKCGVSRMQLYRWRQSESFQLELRRNINRTIMNRMLSKDDDDQVQ